MKFGEIEVIVKNPKKKTKNNKHHKYGFPIDSLADSDGIGESIFVESIRTQIEDMFIAEEAAGVGIVTKQNATADVPVGGEYMNVKKLFPKKKKKKTEDAGVNKRSLSGKTKTFRGMANKLPTDDTIDTKDITAKSKQVNMPDGPYDLDTDSLDKAKLKKMLPKIIDTLDGKHAKAVIGARFGLPPYEKEYTYQQIADALGISKGRVQQIEARAIRMLRHPSRSRELRAFLDHAVNTDISVAEGMFGIDSKTKGAIQNVVAKLSDIPGMWDHSAQTFTNEGMDKLKAVLKNNPKHIKYAVNLTADDFEADESVEETIRKVEGGYRLYSKKGKNLGTFDTRAAAEKHEREVQYFKHKG